MPITRRMCALPSFKGRSSGPHDTYGSALSAQPGRSRGRPANNTSSQLIVQIGLPTLRAPGAPRPGWSHHTSGPDRPQPDEPDTASIMPVNNPLERILREIRRRTRVVGAFPDGQLALNLAAARRRHIAGTAWSTKRYLNIEAAEGPADERCHHCVSQCRAPLSPNQIWTLPAPTNINGVVSVSTECGISCWSRTTMFRHHNHRRTARF
jgi:hypothetical protein